MRTLDPCSIEFGIGLLQNDLKGSTSSKKVSKFPLLTLLTSFGIELLFTYFHYGNGSYYVRTVNFLCGFQDIVVENVFEKRLLSDVILPSDIDVTFDDIGALEKVKDILKELVMLPLQRPELFCKGELTKVVLFSALCFRKLP